MQIQAASTRIIASLREERMEEFGAMFSRTLGKAWAGMREMIASVLLLSSSVSVNGKTVIACKWVPRDKSCVHI